MSTVGDKLNLFIDLYVKHASNGVLGFGESSLSLNEIKKQLEFYKNKIIASDKTSMVGWKNPGDIVLKVINIISNNQNLDSQLKDWSKLDISTNFKSIFTEAEMQQYNKLVDNYQY